MIHFKAKYGQDFALPEGWSEITLSQAEKVFRTSQTLPKYVRDIYALAYEYTGGETFNDHLNETQREAKLNKLMSQMTKDDEVKNLPKIYGQIIQILSGISDEELEKLNRVERTTIFTNYVQTKVMGLLNYPDYEFKGIQSFKVDGVEYFLPSIEEGFGVAVPGADMKAIEFTEISDLESAANDLEGGKWEIAPLIIAILCRPKVDGERERYDQSKAIERSHKFKDLPMDVVLEVFFCLGQLSTIFETTSQIYLEEAQQRARL